MKKILCVFLVALLMVGCLAGCGDQAPAGNNTPAENNPPAGNNPPAENNTPAENNPPAENPDADPFAGMDEIEMIYISTRNEVADVAHTEWLDSITENTGGKVTFEKYLNSSLVNNTRDIPDALLSGIADIAQLNINNYPGMFPQNFNIFSIPFTGITEDCRLDVIDYMYDKYPQLEEEFTKNGLKLIGWNLTNSNNLGVKLGKEYTSIADIKNVKITGSSEPEVDILAAAGAVPVTVIFPEIYQSLEKNVINGFTNQSAPVFAMSFYDHIDNWVVFGENSGLLTNSVAICMSLEKWNSLPDAVKAVFEEAEPERAAKETATQQGFDAMLKKTLEESGKYYVVLNDEQLDEWRPFVQPTVDRILSEMEASYPGFGDMYADLCDYVANYGK